jgi:hypothetical protein
MAAAENTEQTFTLEAYQHMHEYAGWSYRPSIESAEQGHMRSALELARAEFVLRHSDDARVRWEDDDMPVDPGDIDPDEYAASVEKYGNLGCIIERRCEFGHWHSVASLWI